MLNRNLYEVLPWSYLGLGVICILLVKSTVIVIAALLLITAGTASLLMRYHFRHLFTPSELATTQPQNVDTGAMAATTRSRPYLSRTANERRQRNGRLFPLHSASGLVDFDRRALARRQALI